MSIPNPDDQKLTDVERRQLSNTIAALVLSGCGIVCLSLFSRRFPILRKWLGSARWRMRATIAGFVLSYNALSRLGSAGGDGPEAPPPD